jgi:aerobic carbon-monoxide dehydrogenase medium subunit
MYAFNYARPKTLAEAKADMGVAEDGVFLAGGQTLLPALKLRLRRVSTVIDLGVIPGLKDISAEGDRLLIGALATHAAVARSAVVRDKIPALAKLADGIGDAQVRNRGTLGGSIANADPAADYPAAIVALDADIVTDKRQIPGGQFFKGLFETALAPGEIVTAVRFKTPAKAAYIKFRHPASRFALVGVFVAKHADGVRVAVTGAGPSVFRVTAMEQALAKNFAPAALEGIAVPAAGLNSDLHAAADYRAHLIGVLAKRAVAAAA